MKKKRPTKTFDLLQHCRLDTKCSPIYLLENSKKTQIKKCQVLTCSLLKKKNLQLPKNFCIDWELTAPKQCLVWNRKSEWHGALHHFMYYIEAYTLHLNKPLNSYIIQSISSKNRQSIRLLQKALMAKSLFRLIIQ